MRLFIDVDYTGIKANWEGFEFVVNRTSPGEKCIVEKSSGGWNWEYVYEAEYTVNNNVLQIAIPRNVLSLENGVPVFSFKWADNNCEEGDILTLYTDGDAAPGARLSFAFNAGVTIIDQPAEAGKDNTGSANPIIFIAAGIAAIVIIAAAVVMVKKKKLAKA